MAKVAVADVTSVDARLAAAFEVLAESPDGVARMRELVLSLAVRGQLVPQDSRDESAAELLLRVVGRAKAKVGSVPTDLKTDLPLGWAMCRLGSLLVECRNGISRTPNDISDGVRVLRISAATGKATGQVDLHDSRHVNATEQEVATFSLRAGDLLVCRFNGNLHFVGIAAVVPRVDMGPVLYPDKLIRLRVDEIDPNYLVLAMRSRPVRAQVEEMAATTAGNIGINGGQLQSVVLALPPLAEQRRIVARVDELMAWIDQFETARNQREAARIAARDACLATLCAATNPTEVAAAWSTLAARFDTLVADSSDVDVLRQAILSLAVAGRLIAQDECDEPAATFLGRLGVTPDQQVEDVPDGWAACRLGDLLQALQPGWSPSCLNRPKEGGEYGVLKVSACSWGKFLPEENKALPSGVSVPEGIEVRRGDFLVSRANTLDLVARSVVVEVCPPKLLLSDKTVRLVPKPGVSVEFLNLANLSPRARRHYESKASGTSASMRNVSQDVIRAVPLLLPPVMEQLRIVNRVSELMRCCDQLEAALRSTQSVSVAAAGALAVEHVDA
jgi:type I restriction enzyme S subunit